MSEYQSVALPRCRGRTFIPDTLIVQNPHLLDFIKRAHNYTERDEYLYLWWVNELEETHLSLIHISEPTRPY